MSSSFSPSSSRDNEEGGPAGALLYDGLTLREATLLELARDLLDLALGQVGEEWHTVQNFDGGASIGHPSSLADSSGARRGRQ